MSLPVHLDRRSVLAASLALPAAHAFAQAQAYPTKPVKVVVGVPPGGSTDALARLFAGWLETDLGQPTIVENRPGANTSMAAHAVVQASPDGHTLLVATDAYITVPLLIKLPYDPFTSLIPISSISHSPFVYVVHPSTPIHSIKDLVDYARANPGKLHYGSSGAGGSSHLGAEKFKLMTGTNIVHVPYRGAGPALVDALSGQYQLSLWTSIAASSYVKDGRLRALAVTSDTRMPTMPNVPTFAEAGYPQYKHRAWLAAFAPAGTSAPVLATVRASIAKMLASPAVAQKLADNGVQPFVLGTEQFLATMRTESDELVGLIKAANIKFE